MNYCPALPSLIVCQDFIRCYEDYFPMLYTKVFMKDLYNCKVFYNGKPVSLRRYPIQTDGKESSFYHLTHRNYVDGCEDASRDPDFRRSERLAWIKPTIEINHKISCNRKCCLIYEEQYKRNTLRINFFNPDDRYLVVLEDRMDYYLLVTAHYLDYDNKIRKKQRDYDRYVKTGRPI